MKFASFVICVLLILASPLFAGGAAETPKAASTEEFKPVTWRFATHMSMNHAYIAEFNKFAEDMKTSTGGKITITVHPASQLGTEKDVADAMVADTIELGHIGTGEMGKRYPKILVEGLPYFFNDYEHLRQVTASAMYQEMVEEMAAKLNVRMFANVWYGVNHMTTANTPVRSPADLKGVKIRVFDQPTIKRIVQLMGASPVPMALAEVYLALSQKVVEGQVNPIPTIHGMKFYEVQKYLILTAHMSPPNGIWVSEKKFQSLPDDLKKTFLEVAKRFEKSADQTILEAEKTLYDDLIKRGMQVIEPDREAFRKAVAPMVEEWETANGFPGLYEKLRAAK